MRLIIRYLAIWILLGVLVLVGGYWIYWRELAQRVAEGAAAWVAERRALGQEAAYDHLEVRGFPYRLTLEFDRPRLGGQDGALDWRWRADFLTAYFQPWNLHHVIFVTEGVQTVRWRVGDQAGRARIAARESKASLVTDRTGRPLRYALDLRDGTADIAAAGQAAFERVQIAGRHNAGEAGQRSAVATPERAGSIDFAARADGVTLPPGLRTALGPGVELARFVAHFDPPVPAGLGVDEIARWRDDGGVIELNGVEITWGPLALTGEGTVTVDEALRPVGALSSRIKGHGPTLDALTRAGLITSGAALAAKTALGLLEKRDEDGEAYVPAPVTAQDGKLFLGPVPILPLGPVF